MILAFRIEKTTGCLTTWLSVWRDLKKSWNVIRRTRKLEILNHHISIPQLKIIFWFPFFVFCLISLLISNLYFVVSYPVFFYIVPMCLVLSYTEMFFHHLLYLILLCSSNFCYELSSLVLSLVIPCLVSSCSVLFYFVLSCFSFSCTAISRVVHP